MSQESDIIYHLKNIGPITQLECLNKYGCFRLASRINNLRQEGYNIITDTVESNGKRFASYRIAPKEVVFTEIPKGKQAQMVFLV